MSCHAINDNNDFGVRSAMVLKTLKAHVSRSALAVMALGLLLPATASAQARGDIPVFTPTSAWNVGMTEFGNVRGLKSMQLPCILSNEYDNGFVVRFSGGGGKMLAMAVDFRQDAFVKGRKYKAMLSIGDGYAKQVSGSAFTAGTLIFNLRGLNGFYDALKSGKTVELDIDGNVMRFALGGLSGAIPALESCYKGEKMPVIKPVEAPVQAAAVPIVEKVPQNDITPMPGSLDEIVKGADAAQAPMPISPAKSASTTAANNVPRAPDSVTGAPRSVMKPRVSKAVEESVSAPAVSAASNSAQKPQIQPVKSAQWDAKAGEDIRVVLGRWASHAGYDLDWQSQQDGKVAQDVALNGSFEDAVAQLLAENGAGTGLSGHIQTAGGQRAISSSPYENSASYETPDYHAAWSAPKGASLQSVLAQWSGKAGVTLVWKSASDFKLKSPVNAAGSYESAVQAILDQYAGESRRPVGQLNIDPASGARVLTVDLDRAG